MKKPQHNRRKRAPNTAATQCTPMQTQALHNKIWAVAVSTAMTPTPHWPVASTIMFTLQTKPSINMPQHSTTQCCHTLRSCLDLAPVTQAGAKAGRCCSTWRISAHGRVQDEAGSSTAAGGTGGSTTRSRNTTTAGRPQIQLLINFKPDISSKTKCTGKKGVAGMHVYTLPPLLLLTLTPNTKTAPTLSSTHVRTPPCECCATVCMCVVPSDSAEENPVQCRSISSNDTKQNQAPPSQRSTPSQGYQVSCEQHGRLLGRCTVYLERDGTCSHLLERGQSTHVATTATQQAGKCCPNKQPNQLQPWSKKATNRAHTAVHAKGQALLCASESLQAACGSLHVFTTMLVHVQLLTQCAKTAGQTLHSHQPGGMRHSSLPTERM